MTPSQSLYLQALLVEQYSENPCVGGSIPPLGTILKAFLPSKSFRTLIAHFLDCYIKNMRVFLEHKWRKSYEKIINLNILNWWV